MGWVFLTWMLTGLLWLRHGNVWLLVVTLLLGYLWFASALGTFLYQSQEGGARRE